MTTGDGLKRDLGLSKFQFVTIQKVVGLGIPTFVITVDSRHPTVYISYSKILKIKSAVLKQILSSKPRTLTSGPQFKAKKIKMTPPMDLESFDRIIPTRSLIFIRDMAGEFVMNRKMYENAKEFDVRVI